MANPDDLIPVRRGDLERAIVSLRLFHNEGAIERAIAEFDKPAEPVLMLNNPLVRNLPQYQLRYTDEVVSALRIRDMTMTPRGILIIPLEPEYAAFEVSHDWVKSHEPHVGGYLVWIPDGSMLYRSQADFEGLHTAI